MGTLWKKCNNKCVCQFLSWPFILTEKKIGKKNPWKQQQVKRQQQQTKGNLIIGSVGRKNSPTSHGSFLSLNLLPLLWTFQLSIILPLKKYLKALFTWTFPLILCWVRLDFQPFNKSTPKMAGNWAYCWIDTHHFVEPYSVYKMWLWEINKQDVKSCKKILKWSKICFKSIIPWWSPGPGAFDMMIFIQLYGV